VSEALLQQRINSKVVVGIQWIRSRINLQERFSATPPRGFAERNIAPAFESSRKPSSWLAPDQKITLEFRLGAASEVYREPRRGVYPKRCCNNV